ncbi:MAG: HEAT repeat domain-containing protein [Spirochaetes bacterium]|jgi:HEAT repeat protein|nr:HEAT repeat domain-containing protein [Spirochaetota bacterium]
MFFFPNVEKLSAKNDIPKLTQCLDHRNSNIRIAAFNAILEKKITPDITTKLKSMIEDKDPRVRTNAILHFARQGDESVFEHLTSVFTDGNESDKVNALQMISEHKHINHPAIYNVIALALHDKKNYIRMKAIKTIGNLKSKHFVYYLSECQYDKNSGIRYEAIRAFTKIGGPEVERYLISALMDDNKNVSKLAHDTLSMMGTESARKALKDERYMLIRKDMSGYYDKRVATAKRIGDIHLKEGIPLLVKALSDKYKDVRIEAVKALRAFHEPNTVRSIEEMLNDEYSDARIEAIKTLRKIHTKDSLTALEKALDDKFSQVRDEAEIAIYEVKEALKDDKPKQ